mgnify:CR=1 FL=1
MAKATQQLELLFKIESDKERSFANDLQSAQSFFQVNQNKLQEVESYKLEYLKKLQNMGKSGLNGNNYQHYQRFIVQLEEGILAQVQAVETARQVVEQRRGIWLEQRAKVKAVETLLTKKQQQIQQRQDKQEQLIADEFASQKYIRDRLLA